MWYAHSDLLACFRTLKKEEDDTRESLTRLVDQANQMLPELSDADRLTLQDEMDTACDKMNRISERTAKKVCQKVLLCDFLLIYSSLGGRAVQEYRALPTNCSQDRGERDAPKRDTEGDKATQ